jgi:hypothetical protein
MLRKCLISVFLFVSALVLLALIAFQLLTSSPVAPDKQAFLNANVLTMNADNAIAQAVFLESDTIVAVGSNEEIRARLDADTVVHDLAGKTLLPGFVDAHSHFPGFGLGEITVDLNSPPIGTVKTISDIQMRLVAAAKSKAAGQWLIGVGYDDSLLAENRHLTRHDLDMVSTTLPIYLMHISGHIGVANTLALQLSGITVDTPDIEGGVYVKDKDGQLTGVLEETARLKTAELAFDLSLFDFIAMSQQGAREYAAAGVTTAQSGLASEKVIQGLSMIKSLGYIPQRLVLWPDMEAGQRWARGDFSAEKYNTEAVSVGAVKLVADGSIQGYTGYLNQPYHSHGHDGKETRGYPAMSQQELNQRVFELHRAGLQVAVHANGDAAIDAVIEAVAEAQKRFARKDPRHIVIHSQMATPEQLQRMQQWGLTPSFFSAHVYYWGDRHRDIFLGPERSAHISPTRTTQKLNLPFSIHLDTPVVPMSPLFAVWSTVNRLSSSGQLLGADERIDTMQALRAVTIDAAWQVFLDQDRGSIEVGKKADLLVIDGNPLLEPASIKDLRVLETYVGGVSIYTDQPELN